MEKCYKVGFSKLEARTVLNQCIKNHRLEKRIYECPICGKWHLTKMEVYEEKIEIPPEELIFSDKWKELMK